MPYIEFRNINKSYQDKRILENFDLDVEKGQFVTLLGSSGCGKSTLLRILAGLENISSGKVFLDGEDITKKSSSKRNIGMLFQQYSLFPTMTVYNNVAFGLKVNGVKKDIIQDEVKKALSLVNLEGHENKYPSQLSGGEQQRAALARCLVTKPKVLLLDEPFSAIDAKLRRDLQIKVKEIHENLGITTIFVTHDQDEAMILSDKIHLMESGKIAQSGNPMEIYLNPKNEFVASFIGEYNIIGYKGKTVAVRPEVVGLSKFKTDKIDGIISEGIIKSIIPQKGIIRYIIEDKDKNHIKADYIFSNKESFNKEDSVYYRIAPYDILYL